MAQRQDLDDLALSERIQLGVLALFTLSIYFSKLGLNGMANFDDCFYAEKAKEILQNHKWWTLTYNHHPAFENPPFYMWLAALSYKIFGIGVFAAKFPSALMGFLNVMLVYHLGKYLFHRRVGLYAGFILATTYPFLKYSRHAMVDVTLTFFVVSALFLFLLALRKDRRFFLLWGFCIGLAMLVKSVLGLFPLAISGAFLLSTSQWKKALNPFFFSGLAISLFVGCSWYAVEYLSFGQNFIEVHFSWLIFQRGFQGNPEPLYRHLGFLLDLTTYYWPWLPLSVLGGVWMARTKLRKNENNLFVLIWFSLIFIIISLLKARVIWYFMPCFPALALLSGYAADRIISTSKWRFTTAKILLTAGVSIAVLLPALPFRLDKDREKDTRVLAPYVKYFGDRGAKIVALHEEFYGLNNALLFFSDHAAEPLFQKVEDLERVFQNRDTVLCLAHRKDLPEIQVGVKKWYPVKSGEDLMLIVNRELEASEVQAGSGLWKN